MRQIICDCCKRNITEQTIYRPKMTAFSVKPDGEEVTDYCGTITTSYDLCYNCASGIMPLVDNAVAGGIDKPECQKEVEACRPSEKISSPTEEPSENEEPDEQKKCLGKYPAPHKVHRFSEDDKSEIKELYKGGTAIKTIAGRFKTSYSAVYKLLGAEGVLKKRPGETAGV